MWSLPDRKSTNRSPAPRPWLGRARSAPTGGEPAESAGPEGAAFLASARRRDRLHRVLGTNARRVLLDSGDEVVRNAIIWCDQRSEAQSNELSDLFGRDALIRLTCNPPLTNFTLTKLLWVRETEPKNWARVAHVMLPKD